MSKKEICVPVLGDFENVPVIEVHVKPGGTIAAEDALITLESEKASFDVPSPEGGKIIDVLVKVGDKVSEGHADPYSRAVGERRAAEAERRRRSR